LSWGFMLGAPRTKELVEVRRVLECEAARLATERIDEAGLARLEEYLARMRDNLSDLPAFVEADLPFHLEIASAAGNGVLLQLLQSIRSLLRVWVDRALHDEHQASLALKEHSLVFEAIRARDAKGAASTMADHMETAAHRLMDTLEP
jgi:GntR family transcriptional regulator, transcriptional repressor for pyruvate dehydrogenase complex